MNKLVKYLRFFFHILTLTLIIFSLYPGSIAGFIMHGDFGLQPQFGRDFFNISSNHFYTYATISFIGFFSYYNHRKLKLILIYLFFLSVILEVFHLIIPGRTFQIPDLVGNIAGVTFVGIIILIRKLWVNR